MRLSSVAGLRKKTLAAWAGRHLQPGTEVHSDGPACLRGVAGAGCEHVPRYLAEFRYRFNRRYDLEALVPRLLHASVRTSPMPYRLLTLAESCG